MRLPLVLSVVLCALVVAPGASAKGSAPSRVCGSSACVRIADSPHVIISLYAAARRLEPYPESGSWTVPPRHSGESSTPALLAGALLVAAAAVAVGTRRFIRLR